MDIIQELKLKKQKVEQMTQEKLRLEGQLSQQMKQLKTDYDVDNVEAAEDLLDEVKKEKEAVEEKLEDCKQELDKIEI